MKLKKGEFFEKLSTGVVKQVEQMRKPHFEPTGALEPVIPALGDTKDVLTVINNQCNNKGGKTAQAVVVLSNIIWEYDPKYFNFPNYVEWPFKDADGNPIKRIRIVGTSTNVSNDGPIRTEILKWWPRGRYTEFKANKSWYSKYESDTGWLIDVMTFDQNPKDFEGPLISIHWIDEPAKADLIGAFTSRHMKGGILLFTQTPIGAAPMLDVLGDLKEQGIRVIKITSTLDDNSITTGKLNSTGTKRGLMTDAEIDSFKRSCSPDQYDARVKGIGSEKEGKIYKDFNEAVHVREFSIEDPRFQLANCYCALDMHEKCYPFLSWWAIFPPNVYGRSYHVCYNEWPTYDTFNDYYDNVRQKLQFNMTIENLSKIIKMLDYTQYGYNVVKRGIDPGFAGKNQVQLEFTKHDLVFSIPKREKIATQRNKILTLLKYDKTFEIINIHTEPQMYVMPHCINVRRALSRHYWEDNEVTALKKRVSREVESERYKDPIDTIRIFESLVGSVEYMPITPQDKKNAMQKPVENFKNSFYKPMADICLFKSPK